MRVQTESPSCVIHFSDRDSADGCAPLAHAKLPLPPGQTKDDIAGDIVTIARRQIEQI